MARRIRSIKPEILDDAVTAALPHLDWRLFVSLWLMADDYGNLHGHAAQVKGAALWATPDSLANVRESLARLSDASLIRCYTVRGQPYIAICGWAKHQKVDHPGKAVIPGPGQADSATCDVSRESRESLANPREVLATDQDHGPGPRTVDQEEREPAAPAFSLVPPAPDPAPATPDPAAVLAAHATAKINAATGRNFDPASKATLRLCRALLREKRTSEDVTAVVERKAAEWLCTKLADRVCPATLLAADNFGRYLDEIRAGPPTRAPPNAPVGTANHRPLRGVAAAFARFDLTDEESPP